MPKLNATLEDQAQELLDDLGYETIPVPVDKIAKQRGAQLRYSPLDKELCGMVFVKDGVPIIGVNALHHPNRQRFSIAHEIAHLELHRDHIASKVHVDKGFQVSVLRRDANSATGTERLEIEANQFAAALLIPRRILDEVLAKAHVDIDDNEAMENWAKKFKVSKATLEFRIKNLPSDRPAGKR
ncbi:MAG: ImmA/IrrE family metallo-endopeptidase [Alphaproteobacteria bacterium]